MPKESVGNIVVGVDGSRVGLAAVRYAAVLARREGCGVHLVHVLPHLIPMNPMLPIDSSDTFPEVGARIVDAARTEAERVGGPGVGVTTAVVEGSRASALLAEAEGARMIVLGHADRSRFHVFSDRTFLGTSAHATCPVLAVPESWSGLNPDKIVVGASGDEHPDGALEEAFSQAANLRVPLTIVHAWKLDSAYEDIIFDRVELAEIRRRGEKLIDSAIAGLRSEFPEVEVRVVVEHADPSRALLEHANGASLIVLGRRSHHGLPDLQRGLTTRTVIRHSRCLVEVAPVPTGSRKPAVASRP